MIPADVPKIKRKTYEKNFKQLTKNTNNIMIFAGDQKIEHLNNDFSGKGIAKEDANPEHLFQIANQSEIGAFAAQYGLISRYGTKYPKIPYLVKINSKTNLDKGRDPISTSLIDIDQIVALAKQLNIVAIGYTVYPGSEHEHIMFAEASRIIAKAHNEGLVTVLWMYPRGKNIKNEKEPKLIAGAAGISACLGADFVKVNYPSGNNPAVKLKEAVDAAGNTGLICAGGSSIDAESFLKHTYEQIHTSGARGSATGRNIHQKPLSEAIKFCNAISAIVYKKATVKEAMKIYNTK